MMPVVLGAVTRAVPAHYGLVNSLPDGGLNVSAIQVVMILVISSVLSGTALSVRELVKERHLYQRERAVGLSSSAYLSSKVLVLAVISVLQTALFVLVGLIGTKVPPNGVVIPGTAVTEIFVDLAVLSVTSMLIGLLISTLVSKSDQVMPVLVGVTIVQLALSGGLFPLANGLGDIAAIAPARWGLGALGSTINLNVIQASISQGPYGQPPDLVWTHTPAEWGLNIAMMFAIGAVCLMIAWLRLRSQRSRK